MTPLVLCVCVQRQIQEVLPSVSSIITRVILAISVTPVTRNRREDLQYKDDDPLGHLNH